jgi:fucose permease
VLLGAALVSGLGSGAIDAGINAHAAQNFSPRAVNWLHACYGLGAMLGPLLMTGVLSAGLAWRWGYGVLAAGLAALTVVFLRTLPLWQTPPAPAAEGGAPAAQGPPAGLWTLLRRPAVALNVALFYLYTGLEACAGQWSYSLLTEARGIPMGVAGAGSSLFWGSLMAGRIVFGAAAARTSAPALLRVAMGGLPLAALALYLGGGPAASLAALAALGFACAPVYPLLMALTPGRIGPDAPRSIGLQVAAAYLGAATLPGLAGWLARASSLEVLGPFLLGLSLLVLGLHEALQRQAPAR